MIGDAIFARLSTNSPVAAVVGTRIYPEVSTENVYPLIVYAAEPAGETCLGPPSRLRQYALAVTCEARTYQGAQDLAAIVKAALSKTDGVCEYWGDTVTVQSCIYENATDGHDTDDANPERIFYFCEQTYSLWARTS